jgi:hypothetical protein
MGDVAPVIRALSSHRSADDHTNQAVKMERILAGRVDGSGRP